MAPMDFASRITAWQARHGRHDLPWQNTRDPYRIWLSEIMLQQTQVATVIPYYQRFLERFPDVAALAAARQEDVMPYWAGLGYYARARNLHRCAQEIMQRCVGRFPPRAEEIATLPGIGRSTAAAIAAFAYGERSPIMDGNVKRVFTRHFGIEGDPARRAVEQQLWALAAAQVQAAPDLDMPGYTQGLMDLGATLCTRGKPACERCPVAQSCIARRDGRQAELPTPKARKAIPERSTAMLVLHGPDGILLHLRPALAHTFTHYRLHVRPWYLAVRGAALRQAA
ncbi:A/G-specific adenine glycosylase, partial [Bordetella pertussis]|uniref:A/G-specific adenine glycosylase n=1 Tax=Bordetella pertussis TaxID=520 RepID=UPI0009B2CBD8